MMRFELFQFDSKSIELYNLKTDLCQINLHSPTFDLKDISTLYYA